MKLGGIPDPFSGEKLSAIFPRIAPFVEETPRLGRLHYFPGRHLTDTALRQEQDVRVQRLALRGRAATAGVVSGLEVSWRNASGGIEFSIEPGQALTTGGVDIVVDHTAIVRRDDLRLFNLATQQVGDESLGEMEEPPETGFAAVLVLQPGFAEDADRPLAAQEEPGETDFSPCPRVPEDEVFFKTTSTDGARLILYPIPWDEPPGDLWQNRVAWSVFNREAQGLEIPWLELGVPLAIVGFDDALTPLWIDRHTVARSAGRPRRRLLTQPTLDARLWMARFDQFCAQLTTLEDPLPASSIFQFLPPIGLLPKAYLSLEQQPPVGTAPPQWRLTQQFFPDDYTIDVSVIPLEQLDALIADTTPLQPYDLSHVDAVRFLLPVSQQWFDPDLLKIEIIDPAFDQHIAQYREERGKWLAARYDLANRRHALELSANGQATAYPLTPADADSKRLETPELPVAAPPGAAVQYGVTRNGAAANPMYTSQLLADIRASASTYLKRFTDEDIDEFEQLFEACGLTGDDIKKAFPKEEPPKWLARLVTDGKDQTLSPEEKNELRRELLAYIRKQTQVETAEDEQLDKSTLQELIAYFSAKADEADELVDAGFLKVRTDVFRLGNLLSNASIASKFVASPSLANIIERKPAKTDAAGVNAFASQLLANFAPSAVGAAASAVETSAVPTFAARSARLDTGAARATKSTSAKTFLQTLNDTGSELGSRKDVLESATEKLFGANSPLTKDEQTAFSLLRDAATNLTSADTIGQLRDVVDVSNFATSYVANFNLLSQKQIRAIPLDRLQPALAPTVRKEIHDGRLEIFERLTRLGISLGDLTTDFVDAPGTPVRPAAPTVITRLRFQTLISRRRFETLATLTQVDANGAEKEVNDADESRHFSSGVSYADMASAALRAVEARIKDYRIFVERCRAALVQTHTFISQITVALGPIEVELDESRHDVAVALALKAEEQARLDAINAHRARVLKEHVELLVYYRPRAVALNSDVPSRRIEPALTSDPLIECIKENPTPPADLAALRDIFRASPARWFKYAPRWIEKVDRWEHLRGLLDRAAQTSFVAFNQTAAITTGRYAVTLGKIYQTRQASAQKYVLAAQAINPALLVALSWRDLQQQAQQQLTLGHLIADGPAPLAKAAAEELEHIFAVATCLHENFCAVPGVIRLDWAERFGEFDQVSVDFRDLSRLPGWGRIEFTLRREMQIHADWIFGRIDQQQADALDLINDLIRVALLLASHAPVDQLIVGHPIETNVAPLPGGLIKIKVDPLRVRRGMEVFTTLSATQTLRAVVDDISASHVAARVTQMPADNSAPIKLTPTTTFYFQAAAH